MTDADPGAAALRARYADAFARVALDNLSRPYPYAAQHLTSGPDDRPLPVELHPAFATSYDWHSSVHMHWLAARLLGSGVSFSSADALAGRLTATLAAENLAAEAEYLRAHPAYERPYGWGWAMALAAELRTTSVPVLLVLADGAGPLVEAIEANALRWLAATPEPVRHGAHGNTAFGLRLLLEGARTLGRTELAAAAEEAARRWFGADRDWPFHYERSGQDFLSPGLAEADLMRAVLPRDEFRDWAEGFFGLLEPGAAVLRPATVLDETDPQQVHLFGLGLSSAAALGRLFSALRPQAGSTDAVPAADRAAELARWFEQAAPLLLPAGLAAAVSDEYVSTHWLATFAWDALEALPE